DDPTGWATQPIDRFIMARWKEIGIPPVAMADRAVLLRRASFDLIGLPPTPEEQRAFLADDAPDAFAKLVDRLMSSPHYGERWGRHWMDVVRYADTAGDNADYPIPEIYRYRDYIIDAFNADKPFDEFVREQLAGDILAKAGPAEKYAERVVATGFLALSRRYATAPYEFWHLSLEDAIDTTGAAFLGMTLRCARCHDHKFDPVTREDYYGLYAIFASTVFPYAGSEEFASMNKPREHFVPLAPADKALADKALADYRKRLADLTVQINQAEGTNAVRLAELDAQIAGLDKLAAVVSHTGLSAFLPAAKAGLTAGRAEAQRRLQNKLNELRTEQRLLHRRGLPADLPGAYAVQEGKVTDVRVHLRGDPDKPGPPAPRRV